ncbi:GNAT family protein [Lactobacillaceae bacterium L1_55_11]|nr:GNAT family protein [Lactobacillaceae bacterium L1_55_11]
MPEITLFPEDDIRLVPGRPSMGPAVFAVIDQDREHLGKFLPWAKRTKAPQVSIDHIAKVVGASPAGLDLLYVIYQGPAPIGMIEIQSLDLNNHRAEIGYWLSSSHEHRGIMTTAVKALCHYAFDTMGLHQMRIFAEVENLPSNNVIKRSGFTFLATHPDYLYRDGAYRDMNEYYLIAP